MSEFSGPIWVPRFAGSTSLDDLTDDAVAPSNIPMFRTNEKRFVGALEDGGATVEISATWRPAERAYLMHYCCLIAGYTDKAGVFHKIDPSQVPPMAGVDIDWTCGGNLGLAIARATQMRVGYRIAFPAALVSRHTQRLAVDKTIIIPTGATIVDANGNKINFPVKTDGTDARVVAIGKTFGVIKLATDPPHWSVDGH